MTNSLPMWRHINQKTLTGSCQRKRANLGITFQLRHRIFGCREETRPALMYHNAPKHLFTAELAHTTCYRKRACVMASGSSEISGNCTVKERVLYRNACVHQLHGERATGLLCALA